VDRAKNEEADALAKPAARGEALPSDVFYHVIGTPAVRSPEGLQITNDSEGHRIVNLIMTPTIVPNFLFLAAEAASCEGPSSLPPIGFFPRRSAASSPG
jgi:hypothetical protein